MGLAPWLAERHGATVWMSEHAASLERRVPAHRARGARGPHARIPAPARRGGARQATRRRGDHRAWFGGWPALEPRRSTATCSRRAADAGRSIETGGHCRGHLCLHDAERGLLVSGDQVLPTISPNVSVLSSAPDADPLREFLASLERLRACAPARWCCRRTAGRSAACTRVSTTCEAHHHQQLEALRDSLRRAAHRLRGAAGDVPARAARLPPVARDGGGRGAPELPVRRGDLVRQVDANGVARFVLRRIGRWLTSGGPRCRGSGRLGYP